MKILILSPIDTQAIERLAREHDVASAIGASPEEVRSRIVDREVLIFRSGVVISRELMERAPDLKLLIRGGSGYDNVDMDHIVSRDLEFIRIPEPGARSVAELTFGLMLALARRIPEADRDWRQGRWRKHELTGYLLRGKVLGIVGAGSIGAQVGELGAAWGMDAIGCVANPNPAIARKLEERGIRLGSFDEIVETADFLSVHVPLNDSTRNLIDARVMRRMKPGSFLLNMARGGVVDETALRSELLSGVRIRGAALDVHEAEGNGKISRLADLSNVILTPHIGSTTVDTQQEIGERIVRIVQSYCAPRATRTVGMP